MSESDASRPDLTQPAELPPIPDGGLRQTMPDWLTVPPTRPAKLSGPATPLDLEQLAMAANLPDWLTDLSHRIDGDEPDQTAPEASAAPVIEEPSTESPVTDLAEAAAPELPPASANPELAPELLPPPVDPGPELVSPPDELTEPVQHRDTDLRIALLLAGLVLVIAIVVAWLIWG